MLLGQVVAISVASNLFYLALTLSQGSSEAKEKRTPPPAVPAKLWISVLLSLITVGMSPFTDNRTFLVNLLVMHALLVVPLVSSRHVEKTGAAEKSSLNVTTLYGLVALLAIILRTRTGVAAVLSFPSGERSPLVLIGSAWKVFHSHPAQSSIGWDVVWTTLSFWFWTAFSSSGWCQRALVKQAPAVAVGTAFGSVGVGAPYVLFLEAGINQGVKEE
jgi:hypothetical protein